MKKVLVTGASGFIGGFIVEQALDKGWQVFAAVRKSSSRRYLTDPRIRFVELALHESGILSQQLGDLRNEHGVFDYVIHNAGITKSGKVANYFTVNTELTKILTDSILKSDFISEKLIYISSLAAAGPCEQGKETITLDQEPAPVTAYGESKLEAEKFLNSSMIPSLILRPTAVFGPRDSELLTLFSLINNRLELYIGTDSQKLSFIYVKDLADMILAAAESGEVNKTYFISDGKSYLIRDFVAVIKNSLHKKTLKIKVPVVLVSFIAFILEKSLGVLGRVPALNSEKMAELTSENWTCDMSPFFNDIPHKPKYDIQSAVDETVQWYKNEKWI